jgi:hypothetical protein
MKRLCACVAPSQVVDLFLALSVAKCFTVQDDSSLALGVPVSDPNVVAGSQASILDLLLWGIPHMLNVATRNHPTARTKQRKTLREQGLHHSGIGKSG